MLWRRTWMMARQRPDGMVCIRNTVPIIIRRERVCKRCCVCVSRRMLRHNYKCEASLPTAVSLGEEEGSSGVLYVWRIRDSEKSKQKHGKGREEKDETKR